MANVGQNIPADSCVAAPVFQHCKPGLCLKTAEELPSGALAAQEELALQAEEAAARSPRSLRRFLRLFAQNPGTAGVLCLKQYYYKRDRQAWRNVRDSGENLQIANHA